jgi:FkbM family methyltransferase
MQLHKPGLANRLAKAVSKPLSRIVCSSLFYKPARVGEAYLNFLIGKGAGTGWDLQSEVKAAAGRTLRPNPVFFDVGANVAGWTEGMLQRFEGAQVFLFEPSPGCQAVIREKKLPRATLVPCAIGDNPGEAAYYFSSATDGTASLYVRHDTPFSDLEYKKTTVQVRTIDEVIASLSLDFVDFMKMDIEGHELYALRGAQQSLASGKIGALSFEFGCGNINSRTYFRDFWDLLTGVGFGLWRITPSGKEIPVSNYYEDHEYFRGVTNYIAVSKNAQST